MLKTRLLKFIPYCLCTLILSTVISYGAGTGNEMPAGSTHADMERPAIQLHPMVEDYVQNYIQSYGANLDEIKAERGKYFRTIENVFRKYELPVELKYLAVIESNLKPTALSRVGARGMWQLMPVTARTLGLQVNDKVDERIYPQKSTVAAALYLRDLYRQFNDWLLTIAAYNSGPGPVLKAIRLTGSRDFYRIQHLLPKETRFHVKKFIATHYHFEGEGSMVTLTRKETDKYLQALAVFEKKMKDSQEPAEPLVTVNYFQWVAILQDEESFSVQLKK